MMTDCKVDIVVSYQNDILVIRVTNTVRQKPNFIVNKGEEHGLGLKIINSIVNKANEGKTKKEYSFNGFVISACEYALKHME